MFNRKLKEDLKTLELRVKQLECEHKNTETCKMVSHWLDSGMVWEVIGDKKFLSTGYHVRCKDCGKVLKSIGLREKARMEYEQAKEEYNRVCGGDHGE